MQTATFDHVAASNAGTARRGSTKDITGFVAWVSRLFRERQVRDELEGMSDRELADIGLSRWEIRRVAHPRG